jgi:hypothetical protein
MASGKIGAGSFISLHPFKKFLSVLESGTDRSMNRDKVSQILDAHGFKITNMTEMNGLVYFCSRKVGKAAVLRA